MITDDTSQVRPLARRSWQSITICGGGNAAHPLAVVASQNFDGAIDWLVVLPIHEWLRRAYGRVTEDTSSVAACFRTGPIQARRALMAGDTLEGADTKDLPLLQNYGVSTASDLIDWYTADRCIALASADSPSS